MEETMTVPKSQQRAVMKYIRENYDEFKIRMPKGYKAELKAHAEAQGESLNLFIKRAIAEAIERDNAGKASK